jgi:predicted nucleic acid-binding protein
VLVVSDTSVLLNLCRVSADGLLLQLFRDVWVPPAVAAEFSRLAGSRARFQGLVLPSWVRISPAVQVAAEVRACRDLDSGESEALSLALEMHADAVLLDEAAGRRAATVLKVPFVGVAGILIRASAGRLIPAVRPVLERLKDEAGFWLHPRFEAEVLQLAGEA